MQQAGYLPAGSEIDVPLTYADYYFIEALTRYKKWVLGESSFVDLSHYSQKHFGHAEILPFSTCQMSIQQEKEITPLFIFSWLGRKIF